MKKFESLISSKMMELAQREASLKVSDTIKENTRGTQLVKVRRDRKTLGLINELLGLIPEDAKLSKAAVDHINSLTTLAEEREQMHIVCKEGDLLIDLLMKYRDANNFNARLIKYCEKNNLEIDWNEKKIIAKK